MTGGMFWGRQVEDVRITAQVEAWRTNRLAYPGWLVLPEANRAVLWDRTDWWCVTIVARSREQPPAVALSWLAELSWRLALARRPFSQDHADALARSLDAISPAPIADANTLRPGSPACAPPDWTRIATDWRLASSALLRHLREDRDAGAFAALRAKMVIVGGTEDAAAYEACLLAVESGDPEGARGEVVRWKPSHPSWVLKRACIATEVGLSGEGDRGASQALEAARRGSGHGQGRLESLSLEGWAMELAEVAGEEPRRGGRRNARLQELARLRCDPASARASAEQKLAGLLDRLSGRMVSDLDPELVDALPFGVARLCEDGARPARSGQFTVAASQLRSAAVALTSSRPRRSFSLLMRSGGEAEVRAAFSLHRVAALSEADAGHFISAMIGLLSRCPTADEATGRDLVSTVCALAAQLAPRAAPADAMTLLREAVRLLGNPRMTAGWPSWKALRALLEESIFSLPEKLRVDAALLVVGLPLIGCDPAPARQTDLDVSLVLLRCKIPLVSALPPDAERVGERLLAEMSVPGLSRARASMRLAIMSRWGMLSRELEGRAAVALWRDVADWPTEPGIPDWTILNFPDGGTGRGEAGFRYRCLSGPLQSVVTTRVMPDGREGKFVGAANPEEDPLENVWSTLPRPWQGQDGPTLAKVDWTAAELATLLGRASEWWNAEGLELASKPTRWFDGLQPGGRLRCIVGIIYCSALTARDMPAETVEQVSSMLREADTAGFPVAAGWPLLARLGQEGEQEAIHRLRKAFASGRREVSEGASYGVFSWWEAASRGILNPPPRDLVDNLANDVRMRRPGTLDAAIFFLNRILEVGREDPEPRLLQDMVIGLEYLLEDARYRTPTQPDGAIPYDDVPHIRQMAATLAGTLTRFSVRDSPAVRAWRDAALSDPLVAIRHAFSDAVAGSERHAGS